MYRFGSSTEEISIRKIEAGIRGINNGTKTPKDANCNYFLDKLKEINEGMYIDLHAKYINSLKQYNQNKVY